MIPPASWPIGSGASAGRQSPSPLARARSELGLFNPTGPASRPDALLPPGARPHPRTGEDAMNAYAGIWIDHEKAYICMLKKVDTVYDIDEDQCSVTVVESDVESHIRSTGGSRAKTPYGPQDIADDKKIDRRRRDQLDDFLETVVGKVRKARKIYIFGPGMAKKELKKKIDEDKVLAEKVAGVENADKMTRNQMIARVKSFYSD
jgi:hypothetical protein